MFLFFPSQSFVLATLCKKMPYMMHKTQVQNLPSPIPRRMSSVTFFCIKTLQGKTTRKGRQVCLLIFFSLCLESRGGQVKQVMLYVRVERPVDMSPTTSNKKKRTERFCSRACCLLASSEPVKIRISKARNSELSC